MILLKGFCEFLFPWHYGDNTLNTPLLRAPKVLNFAMAETIGFMAPPNAPNCYVTKKPAESAMNGKIKCIGIKKKRMTNSRI